MSIAELINKKIQSTKESKIVTSLVIVGLLIGAEIVQQRKEKPRKSKTTKASKL